ncbi:hypothetical protein [Streptomyces sp. NPDC048663]|uniref:hypothetical protein n=1 Tax=Streptomyces sp. NPDC048663 TaxID=3155638 RepID=UPI00342A3814
MYVQLHETGPWDGELGFCCAVPSVLRTLRGEQDIQASCSSRIDGVARLLTENPPAPDLTEDRPDVSKPLRLLESFGLLPPRGLTAEERNR